MKVCSFHFAPTDNLEPREPNSRQSAGSALTNPHLICRAAPAHLSHGSGAGSHPDVGRNSTGQFVEPGAVYTIALKPKRWRFGRRSGGERIAAFAMKHIQPFRSRLLDTGPIHYFLAFRAIGVRNYR